ncbi:MAG: N-acetyltransferase [Myxococcaceae bacterium]
MAARRTANTALDQSAKPLLPALPSDVTLEVVRTPLDRDRFIEFQTELYRNDPNYVTPIVAERRDFLDPRKNPFFSHAQIELYVAKRAGKIVGRIAAVNDPHYNQFHNTETGFFGMFDCIEDAGIARLLLDAAAAWVARKGMKLVMGPVNLSFNHDCGVLVEGFEYAPVMFMTYNARYYDALLGANGFRKATDLYAYEITTDVQIPDKVARIAERVLSQPGVRVRPINMLDVANEVRRLKNIYNAMLERDWGFVPMSDREFDLVVARLRPLVQVRPELFLIVEVGDEPVAFAVTVPDSNIALKAAGGRLTRFGVPVGLAKLLWATRSIDRLRVLLFGIKPGYRRRGLDAALCLQTVKAAKALGYKGAEVGWIAENNTLLNRAIEAMGGRRYKTWRIYERDM